MRPPDPAFGGPQERNLDWFPRMRAMSLVSSDSEGEQNELRSLQEKLESTMKLVSNLSGQLSELKDQVGRVGAWGAGVTRFPHSGMYWCLRGQRAGGSLPVLFQGQPAPGRPSPQCSWGLPWVPFLPGRRGAGRCQDHRGVGAWMRVSWGVGLSGQV